MSPSQKAVLQALNDSEVPLGALELREITGYGRAAVHTALRRLRDTKYVRIGAWKRNLYDSGDLTPLYTATPGINAIRPRPLTMKQRSRNYYVKIQALAKRRSRNRRGKESSPWDILT